MHHIRHPQAYHEGNIGMCGILAGARVQEQDPT